MNSKSREILIEEVLAHGATRAVALKSQGVILDPRVRLKCQVPNCENYNFNLQCPPNCLSIDEFKEYLSSFHQAILIQVEGPLQAVSEAEYGQDIIKEQGKKERRNKEPGNKEPGNKEPGNKEPGRREQGSYNLEVVFQPANDLHRLINWAESRAFALGYRFASGFIGGCCKLCDKCVGPRGEEQCRHPFQARPSMEAVGIDVYATSEKAGIPIKFPVTDRVVWCGLLLLE